MMKTISQVSLLAFVATQAIAAMDIAGVQIGLPLSTQKAAITKANPSYQLTDIKLTTGKTAGITAIAKKDGKVIDQFVAIQNDAGIVWFVARAQELEKGARIKPEVLLNSLKDKYGTYTELSGGSGGPMWQFDRQEKIYQGQHSTQGPCYAGIGAGASTNIPGTSISVPSKFTPTCGIEIETDVHKDSADGMVSAFTVRIVDAKRMYDELNGKATAKENERKQRLEAEKTSNVKPRL